MRSRTQAFFLAATATVFLSACGQQGSLLASSPSPNAPSYIPESGPISTFDEVLDVFLSETEEINQSIRVGNQTHILLDSCALTDETMEKLLNHLIESQPAVTKEKLSISNRTYLIEWIRDEHTFTMCSGNVSKDKYTIITVNDQVFYTDHSIYTEWVESFATIK